MSRRHLIPEEQQGYLERLGLTDNDKKIYICILDAGLVSVGEVQHLVNITDLGVILSSIRDLVNIGLVKKAKGKMPRYYAILPFVKETTGVERQFVFELDGMMQAINSLKTQFIKSRENITNVDFPRFTEKLVNEYYEGILSPTLKKLEKITKLTGDGEFDFTRNLDKQIDALFEKLDELQKPVITLANLLREGSIGASTQVLLEVNEYKKERTSFREENFENLKIKIEEQLNNLGVILDEFESNVKIAASPIQKLGNSLKSISKNLDDATPKIREVMEAFDYKKDEMYSRIKILQDKLVKTSSETKVNAMGVTEERGATADELRKLFIEVSEEIRSLKPETREIEMIFQEQIQQASEGDSMIQQVYKDVLADVKEALRQAKSFMENITDQTKSVIDTLSRADESSLKDIKMNINNEVSQLQHFLENEIDKMEKLSKETTKNLAGKFKEATKKFKSDMLKLYKMPVNTVTPVIENITENIDPSITDFQENMNGVLDGFLEPFISLEDETFSKLLERIKFVKRMIEVKNTDIQSIEKFAREFDYTRTSDTWVVVGLPSIYATITDLLLRTKVSLTLVTPKLDRELIKIIKKAKSNTRFTYVADISKTGDAKIIEELEEFGRIKLRSYEKRDLYACIRDSEEIIFGYVKHGEDTIGIRSSSPSIIELLEDRLNETVIRHAKQI